MPPSQESIEERIVAAIASTLAGVVAGSSYWYTPTVVRADQYEDKRLFRVDKTPVYVVRDTSELIQAPAQRAFGKDARVLTVFLLLIYHDPRGDSNPFTLSEPSPGTIRHRMIRDVTKALYANHTLGGIAIDLDISDPTKDFEEGLDQWVLAEVPIPILYEHTYDEP